MKKILFLFVIMVLFSPDIWAQKVPTSVLLDGVKKAANFVGAINVEELKSGEASGQSTQFAHENTMKLKEEIKRALDAGVPTSSTVEVTVQGAGLSEATKTVTLAELEAWNNQMLQVTAIAKYKYDLGQAASRANLWVSDLQDGGKNLSREQKDVMADDGNKLLRVLDEAIANGFPKDTKIDVGGSMKNLTELREFAEWVAAAGGAIKQKADDELFAADKPFLEALKGDKQRIWKEEFGGNKGMFEAYTSGMRELKTPQDFARATVWYVWGNELAGVVRVWHVKGWKFRGDNTVGNYYKEGVGMRAPAAAFP